MERLGFFALGVALVSCSALSYKFYGYDLPVVAYEQGKLLGPEPKDDLPFKQCEKTETNQAPCVVLFQSEWRKVQRDLVELTARLKACESQ